MFDCIVLAAGSSSRMGKPKLHLPFGESTLLRTTVAAALAGGCCPVIVVGRRDDDNLGSLASEGIIIVRNKDPSRGMLSSLCEGLALVRGEGFFFIPGDMPLVAATTYELLSGHFGAGPVIPTYSGRRGHPVLMPSSLIRALLELPQDRPLKAFIEASGPTFVEMEDPGVLRDIDDPESYKAAILDLPAASPRA
ncbi:MAG: nucleotidyltransferase family protein [Rectinemataceae bacterium]